MACLRCSSFVECMKLVWCCAPWMNSACVYIAWISVIGDRSSIKSSSRAVQIYWNDDDGSMLTFVCWMYGTVSCYCWTNSWYICIASCVLEFDTCYWCSIQYVMVIISTLRAVQIHYNGDAWRLCVDLCLLNVWNGCRVGPGRTARAFVLLRVCWNLAHVTGVLCSMQYEIVI